MSWLGAHPTGLRRAIYKMARALQSIKHARSESPDRIRRLTWPPYVSIPWTPMRRPLRSFLVVETLAVSMALCGAASMSACAKTPPEAHSAEVAPVKADQKPEQAKTGDNGSAPADNTAPSGVDISKLDEFGKKVFFRIANTESSVCGQAESLIQSAKDPKANCRRSVSALRYVARLVEQGFTDSE